MFLLERTRDLSSVGWGIDGARLCGLFSTRSVADMWDPLYCSILDRRACREVSAPLGPLLSISLPLPFSPSSLATPKATATTTA